MSVNTERLTGNASAQIRGQEDGHMRNLLGFNKTLQRHLTCDKVMVAMLPYEVKRLTQDIGGDIVETGCMPSGKDFSSPEYGHLIQKYLKAGECPAEARFKAARLSEWLTVGGGIPGCMHGGGSPDGAKLVVRATTPLEEYAGYAKKLMNIEEEINDPPRNK
jgi:4-hydroxybutyryl-CoA dehydratase/vinylacetyl-CoA-Delta-isomerase